MDDEAKGFISGLVYYYAGIRHRGFEKIDDDYVVVKGTFHSDTIVLPVYISDDGIVSVDVSKLLPTDIHRLVLRSDAFTELFRSKANTLIKDEDMGFELWGPDPPTISTKLKAGVGKHLDDAVVLLKYMIDTYTDMVVEHVIKEGGIDIDAVILSNEII